MAFLSHVCGPLPSSVSRCEIQPVSFVFHPGDLLDWQSCRELLPTDTELAGLVTLDAVRAWVNLDAAVWQAALDALGTVPSMRVLAVSPADSISSMITGLRLPLLEADGQPMLDADGQPNAWFLFNGGINQHCPHVVGSGFLTMTFGLLHPCLLLQLRLCLVGLCRWSLWELVRWRCPKFWTN